MKKNPKKLRLHRETLAHLDPQAVSAGRAEPIGFVSSCTYPCDCQPGCTGDSALPRRGRSLE